MIDNLAVSGEHAVLQMVGNDVFIEDLNSTNGTYINGKAIKKQLLTHNDTVEIGKYKIKYLVEDGSDYERTLVIRPGANAAPSTPAVNRTSAMPGTGGFAGGFPSGLGASHPPSMYSHPPAPSTPAMIRVLSGAAAGREVSLTKVVTTVGKPGVQVAAITKRPSGYVIAHVEGVLRPAVNGVSLATDTAPLKNGDLIELAGTQMQFIQA